MLNHDVTLSQLRKMMASRETLPSRLHTTRVEQKPTFIGHSASNPANTTTTSSLFTSTEAINPLVTSPMKISIQKSDIEANHLPQVKVTLKQEPNKQALSRLRSPFKSPSWTVETGREWHSHKKTEQDSVRNLLTQDSTEEMVIKPRRRTSVRHSEELIRQLGRQPRMERVRDWVFASPLDSARPINDTLMNELQQQKLSRRVHFGGG